MSGTKEAVRYRVLAPLVGVAVLLLCISLWLRAKQERASARKTAHHRDTARATEANSSLTSDDVAGDSKEPPESDSPTPVMEDENGEIAHVLALLDSLMSIEESRFFFHDVVTQHLDAVLEVMSFLQKRPDEGIAIIEDLYFKTVSPGRKGLLIFIGSAARDSGRALELFRVVMRDLTLDSSVRLACVYGLGMANLPILNPGDSIRWHYATALWAIGNMLNTSHPAQVYVLGISETRPWPAQGQYGWQGVEKRRKVLEILVDALQSETCLRTRYAILTHIHELEDTQLLVETFKSAYVTDGWVIPKGHESEGIAPARSWITHWIRTKCKETRDELWINALRWVKERAKPWEQNCYIGFIVEAHNDLGLIDRAFIEWSLAAFTKPELCEGDFPSITGWTMYILPRVKKYFDEEEQATLLLQIAKVATTHADKQIQLGATVASECLQHCKGLSTEGEICKILLGHPYMEIRRNAVRRIEAQQLRELIDDLVRLYFDGDSKDVHKAIEKALYKLAPDVLARLPERRWPTQEERLDEMYRQGRIDAENYKRMLDYYASQSDSPTNPPTDHSEPEDSDLEDIEEDCGGCGHCEDCGEE